MKKKWFALVIAGTMVFSLAACGNNDSGSSSDAETAEEEQSTETAEEEESTVAEDEEQSTEYEEMDESEESSSRNEIEGEEDDTLTVWCWDTAFNIEAMMEAGRMYKEIDPDFGLTVVETLSDDCETKLINAASSGQLNVLPDIILMQDESFQKYLAAYPEVFTDLTDSGIEFSDFAAGKLNYSVKDGRNYGIPFDNGAAITCWRTDILEEAGYTIEDVTDIDFDRFMEIARDIKDTTGMYVLSGWAAQPYTITMMLQSAGGSLFDEDGNAYIEGNDILRECVEDYVMMVEEGIFYEVNSWTDYMGTISDEKVACVMNGNWITGTIMSLDDSEGKWAVTNLPSLVDAPNATNYSNSGGSTWYITTNCQNTDLAIDFMKNTFAGSVEFYENILPTTGAISSYLPAGDSEAYSEPQPFWDDQPIFKTIVEYSEQVPVVYTSPYYFDALTNLANEVENIIMGADIDEALESAQKQTEFDIQ